MKKSVLKEINEDLRRENEMLKADALNQHKTDMAYIKSIDKIIAGLCDTVDAKDAEFKKAVREGIVKLKLRDKLLKIFNVVVED